MAGVRRDLNERYAIHISVNVNFLCVDLSP